MYSFVGDCKPTAIDIETRETILRYLQAEFKRKYVNCRVCAFGSFYNGFGFQQSDLDVCVQIDMSVRIRLELLL